VSTVVISIVAVTAMPYADAMADELPKPTHASTTETSSSQLTAGM
jgi:hypothetical protein